MKNFSEHAQSADMKWQFRWRALFPATIQVWESFYVKVQTGGKCASGGCRGWTRVRLMFHEFHSHQLPWHVCRENTHRSTFDPEPSGYSLTLLTPVALPANKIRDVKIIERFNMIIQYSTIQWTLTNSTKIKNSNVGSYASLIPVNPLCQTNTINNKNICGGNFRI